MMALVRVALTRPLTFIVLAIAILMGGVVSATRMPVDIFPRIGVPVIAVAWTYNGLSPRDMAGRIVTPYERVLTTTVNDIERIESQSLSGVSIVRIYFQPEVDIRTATAQVTSVSQTVLRQMPAGITPPFIVNYDASTVPILQLALSGDGLSEQQLFDLGLNQIRPQLVTVPGAAVPFPSGGKQRQIQIDVDPVLLQANGLSAQDVADALTRQTQINPVGFAKIGKYQYSIGLNNAPESITQLNTLPVKVVDGATIRMQDIAHVRDGSAPQTNIVHVDGQRSALLTVLKSGGSSTLSIVDGIKKKLPAAVRGLPDTLSITPIADQSILVKAAIWTVVISGVLAASLTSVMILLFFGSWRSTVIIVISIPLSILGALLGLALTGQTINIMTLGGLALAIGMLVDDATVTIENINSHIETGKSVRAAIMDGAAQIVTPAFVALLCICIVFVPMFYLPGVGGYLFAPMALAVIFAMLTSFLLSRTLVLTMAMYLLRRSDSEPKTSQQARKSAARSVQRGFVKGFDRLKTAYELLLVRALAARMLVIPVFFAAATASLALVPLLGRDFFPTVDSGQIALHVRAPPGTRIEETSRIFAQVQEEIRAAIPDDEIVSIIDNIGLSTALLNIVYANSGTVGPNEGDILLSLKRGARPTAYYIERLREELPLKFPGLTFAYLPADMTTQILNFGNPAPIDIQIRGRNIAANEVYARHLLRELRSVPGLADLRLQQSLRYPQINVNMDRSRMAQYGIEPRDVTQDLGLALAGTQQTSPVFFLNPENGVSYPVVAQVPEHRIASLDQFANLSVSSEHGNQTLGALGDIRRGSTMSVLSKYDIQPVLNVYATPSGRDLGSVSADILSVIERLNDQVEAGATVTLRGQYQIMQSSFSGLMLGLVAAAVLIYLIIVVNFQSWIDPLIIISALPVAIAGVIWVLFVTGTTLSVPALTGAIMCLGVATANAILVVSFARERLAATGDPLTAAREAGVMRFRPVVMTAITMVIGTLPMAMGLGEGGEQNAPLGRAVIGGLIFATGATLFLVPALFSLRPRYSKTTSLAVASEPDHA